MGIAPSEWLRRLARGCSARQWSRLSRNTGAMPLSRLRPLREEALELRRDLNEFLAGAGRRLDGALPPVDVLDLPGGTDWRWRPWLMVMPISPSGIAAPDSGTRLSDEAALWHDAPGNPLILRQVPNVDAGDLTPYGIELEAFGFDGSFLSIAVDLPQAALNGLTRANIIRLDLNIEVERPVSLYGRLNIGNGPNVDQISRHLGDLTAGGTRRCVIEFDLYLVDMNEDRLEKIWLDIIIEKPAMSRVVLRDIFLSRHLRAEI